MNNIEVGDLVQVEGGNYCEVKSSRTDNSSIRLGGGLPYTYDISTASVSNVIKAGTKPHPHKDLIIAWAHGAEIEYYNNHLGWRVECCTPCWSTTTRYRIKPSKSPNQVEKESIEAEMLKLADRLKELDV